MDISGTNMAGAPGTAAKIFDTLADADINVMMITQNPSESSITITVRKIFQPMQTACLYR